MKNLFGVVFESDLGIRQSRPVSYAKVDSDSKGKPEENPISLAISRPFWRAETISWSDLIATWISPTDTMAHSQFVVLNFSFK